MEQLKRRATYGDTRSATSFSTGVGNESAAEDLSGSRRIIAATSSAEAAWKCRSDDEDEFGENDGEGDPDVARRTVSTLSKKKWTKLSAVIVEPTDVRPRPSRASTDRQSRRGSDCSEATRARQKLMALMSEHNAVGVVPRFREARNVRRLDEVDDIVKAVERRMDVESGER